MRDIYHNTGDTILLEPQDLAHTNTLSAIIDTVGFAGVDLKVIVSALTGVDGSNYLTIVAQESATTATGAFTTVAAGDLLGAFTVINSTSKDSLEQKVGYIGNKRYVRISLVYTGTTISAGVVGVIATVDSASTAPVTAPAITATT